MTLYELMTVYVVTPCFHLYCPKVLFPRQEVVLLPRELLPKQGGVGRGSYDLHSHHACSLLSWDSFTNDDLHEEGILSLISLFVF